MSPARMQKRKLLMYMTSLETNGAAPSAQVEASAARAAEAAGFHARGVQREHAEPRGTHHPGHEHRPAVHEGSWEPNAR